MTTCRSFIAVEPVEVVAGIKAWQPRWLISSSCRGRRLLLLAHVGCRVCYCRCALRCTCRPSAIGAASAANTVCTVEGSESWTLRRRRRRRESVTVVAGFVDWPSIALWSLWWCITALLLRIIAHLRRLLRRLLGMILVPGLRCTSRRVRQPHRRIAGLRTRTTRSIRQWRLHTHAGRRPHALKVIVGGSRGSSRPAKDVVEGLWATSGTQHGLDWQKYDEYSLTCDLSASLRAMAAIAPAASR